MAQAYITLTNRTPGGAESHLSVPLRELIATTVLYGMVRGTSFTSNSRFGNDLLVKQFTDLAVAAADALIDRLAGKTS